MKKIYKKPEAVMMCLETEGIIAASLDIDTDKGGNDQFSNDKEWDGREFPWDNSEDE